jgi:hypothetical protein
LALLSNALRYCEAHQTGNISKKLKSIIIVKKIDSTNWYADLDQFYFIIVTI